MLTYTSAELRLLSIERRPPQRAVRKKLFTFWLWRPARRRQLAWQSLKRAITIIFIRTIKTKTKATDRSSSITIGWLNAQSLRNKTDCIHAAVAYRSIDVLALTETWHTFSDKCLRLATRPSYSVVDVARSSHRGGGVAIIFRNWSRHCFHFRSVLLSSHSPCIGRSVLCTSSSFSFIDPHISHFSI